MYEFTFLMLSGIGKYCLLHFIDTFYVRELPNYFGKDHPGGQAFIFTLNMM